MASSFHRYINPIFSADGQRLIFGREPIALPGVPSPNGSSALFSSKLDGTDSVRLTDGPELFTVSSVDLSPDGRRLALATFRGVFVMGADGSGIRRIPVRSSRRAPPGRPTAAR